jgi:LL-diaminopimelate aminotransferase
MSVQAAFDIRTLYSENIAEMETYIMFRIAKRVAELTPELTAKGRAPIKLSIGAPVADPPAILLEKTAEFLKTPGLHTYSTPRGEKFFLEAVQQRMKNRFHVDINPNTDVCSLLGSKEGLANMFRALITHKTNPAEQDVIMVPNPGYASYVDAIQICGGLPYAMKLTPENQYKPSFEALLQDMASQGIQPDRVKAMIISYPSNPIGATAGLAYYEKAVAFCQTHHILLISDLAYADVYFPGEDPPHSILEVPGASQVAIEFHSLSKPYGTTGWRLGFAVGHPDAIEALERVKGTIDSGLFKVMQKAAAFAMNSPECFAYAMTQNQQYEKNQLLMVEGFSKLGWPMSEISPPRATFYLWLPIPPRYKSSALYCTELLEKSGIVAVPGTAFGHYGEGFYRMSLVDTEANLREVLSRMETDGFTYV